MLENYIIDFANKDDMPNIIKLEHEAFNADICEDVSIFEARMSIFPKGFIVLRSGDEILAYLCTELWDVIPNANNYADFALGHNPIYKKDGRVLYIASMAISKKARGKGLGSLMFIDGRKYIHAANPGIMHELLIVNETWLAAKHIYESENFLVTGTIQNFFISNSPNCNYENGIIMRKDLN